jgi:Tfp pilus assembly protein PilN
LLVTGELSANTTASELILAGVGHPVEPLTSPLKLPRDLPGALFAANIGLALKKLPLKGEASLFRDINLNILSGKFRTGARRLKLTPILLSLVVLIGLGLLLPMNQLRSQTDVETTRLQNELTGVNQELSQALSLVDKAKQIGDTIDKISADAAAAKKEQQKILNKGGDVAYNLGLVTGALPTGTYFTSVGIGADQITVKGEAENSFKVVGYVEALEKLGKFSEVRIVSIDESKIAGSSTSEAASTRISFNVVISK